MWQYLVQQTTFVSKLTFGELLVQSLIVVIQTVCIHFHCIFAFNTYIKVKKMNVNNNEIDNYNKIIFYIL